MVAFSSNAITYQNFASGNSVQQTKDQVDAMAYDGAATQTVSGLEVILYDISSIITFLIIYQIHSTYLFTY